jgi:hypothetical protein
MRRLGATLAMLLFFCAAGAEAWQAPESLARFLPAGGEAAGWSLVEPPQGYGGEDLYQLINGGADIYHEYGFRQALVAEYANTRGKAIKLELYEMTNPAAAYGIFSFKIGEGGAAPAIGQDARIEEHYLNFWKGNLQLTLIGRDAAEETVRGLLALAAAAAGRIAQSGGRPALVDLLVREPLPFAQPKYLRGPLGLANHYRFDREDIFRVREGLIGAVGACRAMVFRYADDGESAEVFAQAAARLAGGSKFTDFALRGDRCAMVGRGHERVVVFRVRRHIAVVIGPEREKVEATADRLLEKLRGV